MKLSLDDITFNTDIMKIFSIVIGATLSESFLVKQKNSGGTTHRASPSWPCSLQRHEGLTLIRRVVHDIYLNAVLLAGVCVGMMNPARANSGTGDSKSTAIFDHPPWPDVSSTCYNTITHCSCKSRLLGLQTSLWSDICTLDPPCIQQSDDDLLPLLWLTSMQDKTTDFSNDRVISE